MEVFWIRRMPKIPKSIKYALMFGASIWLAIGFKEIEPTIFPVVDDFTIDNFDQVDGGTKISGTMYKTRDCQFKDVIGYSGRYLVDVQFTETKAPVSRVEGAQAWGVWLIVPQVTELTLYARHKCLTGYVTTELFDGLLLK